MRRLLISSVLFFTVSSAQCASADAGPFAKLEKVGDSIHATFHGKGVRYRIKIGDRDLGLSSYGQTIVVPEGRTLSLSDKHSLCSVWPRFSPPPSALVGTCHIVGPDITDDIRINWISE